MAIYYVNLFTLAEIVREQFLLLQDMYGEEILQELSLECKVYLSAIERLEKEANWSSKSD